LILIAASLRVSRVVLVSVLVMPVVTAVISCGLRFTFHGAVGAGVQWSGLGFLVTDGERRSGRSWRWRLWGVCPAGAGWCPFGFPWVRLCGLLP
jgi:hypothetical protein